MAEEKAPAKASAKGGSDLSTTLSRKVGPFDLWVWAVMVLGIGAALIYRLYKGNSANTTSTSTATDTNAADIPQIVNQTYPQTTVYNNVSNDQSVTTPPASPVPPPHQGNPPHIPPPRHILKPPPAKSKTVTYTVQPGDTLTAIAKAYGLSSWKTLYDDNKSVIGGDPNLIKPGQRLVVSGATKTPKLHATEYTVRSGDTLSGIARKYDTTWEDLYAEAGNKKTIGSNPNLIRPGEKLTIQTDGVGF